MPVIMSFLGMATVRMRIQYIYLLRSLQINIRWQVYRASRMGRHRGDRVWLLNVGIIITLAPGASPR